MVDDDEEDVYLTRRAFDTRPAIEAFRHVPDGPSLFAYLAREGSFDDPESWPPPRLILMDINMPRESGFVLLERLRADPAFAPIPVIMFSTSTADCEIDRAYRLGANSFIGKPTDTEGMRAVARHVDEFWFEAALTP